MEQGGKNGRTRGGCEEDGGTDRLEEVEFLAHLYTWNEGGRKKKKEKTYVLRPLCVKEGNGL